MRDARTFRNVAVDRRFNVTNSRYVLPLQLSTYRQLAARKRFVVKRDPLFRNASACKSTVRSLNFTVGYAPVYRDFTVKKDRIFHDVRVKRGSLCSV